MCVCLNCSHIFNCDIYFLIEANHSKSVNHVPIQFFASSPVIIISSFLQKITIQLEWDVVNCNSYNEKPGNWVNYNFRDITFKDQSVKISTTTGIMSHNAT